MPDEDEIDRLICRLGMPAMFDRMIQCFGMPEMIAEFERRKRRRRGARPQNAAVYLFEMARIIYSPISEGGLAKYQPRPQWKGPQIGRVAGIIADRQKPKSREALIKTLKRQFRRYHDLLTIVTLLNQSDIQSILSSYHFDIELMDDCITPRWLIMNAALVRAFARAGFTIVDTGYRPPASPLHLSLAPLLDLDPQATGQFPEIMSGFRDTSQ